MYDSTSSRYGDGETSHESASTHVELLKLYSVLLDNNNFFASNILLVSFFPLKVFLEFNRMKRL